METGRLSTEGRHYVVVALADCYVAGPLPLRRDENSELLERQGSWVRSNVTTVVGCNGYLILNEVELNSVILLCGATTFYRRFACAKPALSRLQSMSLYGLTKASFYIFTLFTLLNIILPIIL